MSETKKIIFLVFGFIFFAAGVAGMFLPLVPTTPFLLLTAFCFNHSSEKFHKWLIHHPMFGPPILDWRKNRMIRTKYKVVATMTLAVSLVFVLKKYPFVSPVGMFFLLFILALLFFIWKQRGREKDNHVKNF